MGSATTASPAHRRDEPETDGAGVTNREEEGVEVTASFTRKTLEVLHCGLASSPANKPTQKA